MMLLQFLNDMMRDPDLKEAFLRDPEKVMKQSDLSESHRKLLEKMDVDAIGAALAEEVRAFTSGGRAPWIASSIKVTSVSPAEGQRGETVSATVEGWFFGRTATCKLSNGQESIDGTVESVESGVRSTMEVSFSLPEDASAGSWTVTVMNDEAHYDSLPFSFTITPKPTN